MINIILFVAVTFWGDSAAYNLAERAQSPAADIFFSTLSSTSGREAVISIPFAYSLLGGERAHTQSKPMVVGAVSTGLLVTGIKYITNRPRPDNDYTRMNSSFPSGHAAISFYYATYIGELHPRMKWPLYVWAVGVGLSRIYLKRHWLSDVVVGAVIGWGMAKLTLKYGEPLKRIELYE